MIKMRPTDNMRDQAFAAVEYVDAHARQILEKPAAPLAEPDAVMLANIGGGIIDDLRDLERLFDLTLTHKASEAAYQLVSKLIIRAHFIGTSAVHSPEAEHWRGAVRTMHMRKERSEKPERIALKKAVLAEHGDGPVERSSKEAAAILTAVNKRLEQDGFAAVKVDTVRRELEKLPRSSRAKVK